MELDEIFNETYAYGKLSELVSTLFIGLAPAREKLTENIHFIFIISPSDFKLERHQNNWELLQKMLGGKFTNDGTQAHPKERLTVQNATLEKSLTIICEIYEECNDRSV